MGMGAKLVGGLKSAGAALARNYKSYASWSMGSGAVTKGMRIQARAMGVTPDYVRWVTRPEKGIINMQQMGLQKGLLSAQWQGRSSISGIAKAFMTGADRPGLIRRPMASAGRVALVAGGGIMAGVKTMNYTRRKMEEAAFGPTMPMGGGRIGTTGTQLGPSAATLTNMSMLNRRRNAMVYRQYRQGGRFI